MQERPTLNFPDTALWHPACRSEWNKRISGLVFAEIPHAGMQSVLGWLGQYIVLMPEAVLEDRGGLHMSIEEALCLREHLSTRGFIDFQTWYGYANHPLQRSATLERIYAKNAFHFNRWLNKQDSKINATTWSELARDHIRVTRQNAKPTRHAYIQLYNGAFMATAETFFEDTYLCNSVV